MDFSRAVKGTLTRDGVLREIDSQSDVEFGRHLNAVEKTSLFARFSPALIQNRIDQVFISSKIFFSIICAILVRFRCPEVFGISFQQT